MVVQELHQPCLGCSNAQIYHVYLTILWGSLSGIRLNGGTRTPSTMSIASTTTSHSSVDWHSTEVNKDGKTFKQSVVFHFCQTIYIY